MYINLLVNPNVTAWVHLVRVISVQCPLASWLTSRLCQTCYVKVRVTKYVHINPNAHVTLYIYLKRSKGWLLRFRQQDRTGGGGISAIPIHNFLLNILRLIYFVMSVTTCSMTRYFCLLGCLSFHKIFMQSIYFGTCTGTCML